MTYLAETALRLSRARVDRSADLFAEFGQTWKEYLETTPSSLELSVDDEGHGSLKVTRHEPIPTELSLIFGAFLHELRAGLDNCLYAVAIIDSGHSPPPSAAKLQWPICLTPAQWRTERRRLSQLSAGVLEMLEAIQPYNAEVHAWNALRILHDLARVDRHRTPHSLSIFNAVGRIGHNEDLVRDLHVCQGMLPADGVVATFIWLGKRRVTPKDLVVDVEFDVELAEMEMSVGPFSPDPQRPYGSLEKRMRALHHYVVEYTEGLVFHAKEPEKALKAPTEG